MKFSNGMFLDYSLDLQNTNRTSMALWYMINLFVSAFGNILAYALIKLDGAHGIAGWRWIFIIEGTITVGASFIGYFFTLPFPDQLLTSGKTSRTFSQSDLQIVLERVQRDRGDADPDGLTFGKVVRHAMRWELWVYGFMFFCCSAPIYAFAYFIQIILTSLGYGTAMVFLLCAPPYLASIFWTLAIAWFADRTRLRMPWMVLNAALTLIGLLLTAYHKNTGVRYFGMLKSTVIKIEAMLITAKASSSVSQAATLIYPPSWRSNQTTSEAIPEGRLPAACRCFSLPLVASMLLALSCRASTLHTVRECGALLELSSCWLVLWR